MARRRADGNGAEILGRRVAELRRARGLTLRALARRAGLSESTLSRLENNRVMIGAHSLLGLAAALGVDIAALFRPAGGEVRHAARRAVTRKGAGIARRTDRYRFELLCADITDKAMVPAVNHISARTLAEAGGLAAHPGEEFVLCLGGRAVIHSEAYAPVTLGPGDSLYMDGTMKHAYTRAGRGDAVILVVTTTPPPPPRRRRSARLSS